MVYPDPSRKNNDKEKWIKSMANELLLDCPKCGNPGSLNRSSLEADKSMHHCLRCGHQWIGKGLIDVLDV